MNNNKKNYILLIIVALLRYLGDSFFYGFLTRYIKGLNLTDIRLGILTAVIPFMAIIGNFFIYKLGTNYKRRKYLYLTYSIIEPSLIMFFGFYDNFYYVLMLDIVCNFCSNAFYNIMDTYIVKITSDNNKPYSLGRVFGTVGYIIGIIVGGLLISAINYKYTFLIGGGLMLSSTIFFLFIRFPQKDVELMNQNNKASETTRALFKNKKFIIYMIGAALILGSIWSGDNFFAQLTVKATSLEYSISFDSAIVLEAIVMVVCARFATINNYKKMTMIASLTLVIRYIVFSIPNLDYHVYLYLEILRGFSFGMFTSANIILIGQLTGKRLQYQGYFLMVVIDELIASVFNLAGPSIISIAGNSFTPIFVILASTSLIGFVLILITKFNNDRKNITMNTEEVNNGYSTN